MKASRTIKRQNKFWGAFLGVAGAVLAVGALSKSRPQVKLSLPSGSVARANTHLSDLSAKEVLKERT